MKLFLRICLAFVLTSAYCFATWHPYVGIGIGVAKSQNTFTAKYSNFLTSDSHILNMDTTGTNESIIVGLCNQQKNFFIASELFSTVHQFNLKRKGTVFYLIGPGIYEPAATLDFEVQQKYSNGISFQVGKDLSTMIDVFLKADIFLSKFVIKYVNAETPGIQGQENKWLFGYAPGVGMQVKITPQILTRLDYSYRIYNDFRSKNISRETEFRNTVITGKILPRIHQFTLSLIYRF